MTLLTNYLIYWFGLGLPAVVFIAWDIHLSESLKVGTAIKLALLAAVGGPVLVVFAVIYVTEWIVDWVADVIDRAPLAQRTLIRRRQGRDG